MKASLICIAAALILSNAAFSFENLPAIKRDCGTCHSLHSEKSNIHASQGESFLLKEPVSELCPGCHAERVSPADHPVDVPATPVEGLPLEEGKITCLTCHEPHGRPGEIKLLRAAPEELCAYCHQK